jgi:hypothetical protein
LPTAIEGERVLIKKHMLVDTVETSTKNAKNIKNLNGSFWNPTISLVVKKKRKKKKEKERKKRKKKKAKDTINYRAKD